MKIELKFSRVPAWWQKGGIDLEPYIDTALERIGSELERRQGRGRGARVNTITRQRQSAISHRITSTRRNPAVRGSNWPNHPNFNPRVSGRAWADKAKGRFTGMSPRVVRKYIITPLRQLWKR